MSHRPPRLIPRCLPTSGALWFVTFNTHKRTNSLASVRVHERFRSFFKNAEAYHIYVGRYVIMPDHVHLFVIGGEAFDLAGWVRSLKLYVSQAIESPRPHWQEGFFDHLLRHGESYGEKWIYVQQNPVHAGLVSSSEEWPYQGEVHPLFFE